MRRRSKAARRYAVALLDLACEAGQADAVREDLVSLQAAIRGSADLVRFLTNYLLPRAARAAALGQLLASRLSPLAFRFVMFLESKRRLGLLSDVCEGYVELDDQRKGIVRGQLGSPFDLDADAVQAIREWARLRIPGELDLTLRREADLLGGVRLQVGSFVYDLSLAAQLRMLRESMIRV